MINFEQLELWFNENRIPRNYNSSDNRHIEGHSQYIKGKSPILGGNHGKKLIESLLKNAIGDQRESKDLMNYDNQNKCFVWFEYENDNPQNQYHGYHLVKPNSHDNDENAENKIPQRVKAILQYRQNVEKKPNHN